MTLTWERGTDLPDPVGFKGMYGGVSRGSVLLAGGSNFPVPQRAGGTKTFHRTILLQRLPLEPGRPWETSASQLSRGLAEGASVTADDGVVCLGGHDGARPVDDAFMLRLNPASGQVEQLPLPRLPRPLANAAAAFREGVIYLAGGDAGTGGVAGFWSLDLAAALQRPEAVSWESLPVWPGPERFGAVLAVVAAGQGGPLLLAGGMKGPTPATGPEVYLDDAYRYDPYTRQWTRTARLPRAALLAASIAASPDRVVLLGGSDGHDFHNMKSLGERYRIPDDILVYDARQERWTRGGTMPLGVVAPAVVGLDGAWLLAGGEYSPGLRTPNTYLVRPSP